MGEVGRIKGEMSRCMSGDEDNGLVDPDSDSGMGPPPSIAAKPGQQQRPPFRKQGRSVSHDHDGEESTASRETHDGPPSALTNFRRKSDYASPGGRRRPPML